MNFVIDSTVRLYKGGVDQKNLLAQPLNVTINSSLIFL